MGYDQHQESSSSGTLVAVFVVVGIFAVLALLLVAAGGLFFMRPSTLEAQPPLTYARMDAADLTAIDAAPLPPQLVAKPMVATVPISVTVQLDRDGTARIGGEEVDRDELKSRLAALKNEANPHLRVTVNADPDCLARHIASVLDVCAEISGVDYRIEVTETSDSPLAGSPASK